MNFDRGNDLTVVIPTFNRSQELVRALESLVTQTDSDFEVIVCDDGSTENIAQAIEHFDSLLRLRLLRIDNSGGPARPRNIATKEATTRWISYLDSDDWWFPSRIERLKTVLCEDCDLLYHSLLIERADKDGNARPRHGGRIGEPWRFGDALMHMIRFGNPLPTSATTVRREAMQSIGGFEESRELASVEDFDAWLRLAAKGFRLKYLDEVLGTYWVGSDQISVFNVHQLECQRQLFERQLNLLPTQYRARARSNFAYLLGSYILDLGLSGSRTYLKKVCFSDEPLRWAKAQMKLLLSVFRKAVKP
jgi:glycosyltransferase involved in cell wall biosynthesis